MEDGIAIIGMGLRLGGGIDDEKTFWEVLTSGTCTRSEVPASRFDAAGFPSANQGGHFITQDLDEWDSRFFRTLPQEASALDPQQRLMLEVVYEAVENSGTPMDRLTEQATGCFIGGANTDWHDLNTMDLDGAPLFGILDGSPALISGRISWFFNLSGPSLTSNTMCSSSLVALDAACQSLREGTVKMAIVGGVNLCPAPFTFEMLNRNKFISPDGRSKPFSSSANGYGRGEAATALLLKPLHQAVKDGDPIRALIRSTGVNHDGTTVGVALPSEEAQFELLRAVYSRSNLDLRDTVYVEAHGTGTAAGDPIECRALERAARQSGRSEKLLIGSVKGNTGHTEFAAGLVGMIKAVLMFERSEIAPTVVVGGLTTAVPWTKSLLQVVQERQPWPPGRLKRAGVSSFGASGTNVHVIVDGPDESLRSHIPQGSCAARPRLFCVTTNDRDTLTRQLRRLHSHVVQWDHYDHSQELERLRNLAYTLSVRRSILPWKCTVVADSKQELLDKLHDAAENSEEIAVGQKPDIVFVFTGQGAQWPRMGIKLMQYGAFELSVRSADKFIRDELDSRWSVLEELSKPKDSSQINLPEYSQTLCTVLQIALVDLLADFGIHPKAVVGHSSGEIAAAYCSGEVSREDCLRIAYWRGQACATLTRNNGSAGAMLAASMELTTATAWTSEPPYSSVTVACENSPRSVTFSGDLATIRRLHERCQQASVWSRELRVPLAYHSPSMMPAADHYLEKIQDCVIKRVRQTEEDDLVMISSVTCERLVDDEIGPGYWIRNLVMPVRFSGALQKLVKDHVDPAKPFVVVEIGPSNTLRTAVADNIAHIGRDQDMAYLSALDREQNDVVAMLKTVGSLFTNGCHVDFERVQVFADEPTPQVLTDLPKYAWNRRPLADTRSRTVKAYLSRPAARQGLLGPPMASACPSNRIWRSSIRLTDHPWLSDHIINDAVLFPAVGYISLIIEAGRQLSADNKAILRDCFRNIAFERAIVIPEDDALEMVVSLQPSMANWYKFEVCAGTNGKPLQTACSGEWKLDYSPEPDSHLAQELALGDKAASLDYQEKRARCVFPFATGDFYEKARSLGYDFGPSFRWLDKISASSDTFCASISWDRSEAVARLDMKFDPLVLDAVFQSPLALTQFEFQGLKHPPTPQSIASLEIAASILDGDKLSFEISGRTERIASNKIAQDISVIGAGERQVIHIGNLICAETRAGRVNTRGEGAMCHRLIWGPDLRLNSISSSPHTQIPVSTRGGLLGFAELAGYIARSLDRPKVLLVGEHDSPLHHLLKYPPDNISRIVDITCIESKDLISASQDQTYDLIICWTVSSEHKPSLGDLSRLTGDQSLMCLAGLRDKLWSNEDLSSPRFQVVYITETEYDSKPIVTKVLRAVQPTPDGGSMPRVVLIKDVVTDPQVDQFALLVQKELQICGTESSIETLSTESVFDGASVISLLELQTSFLSELTEARLVSLKSLLSASTQLLWVTRIAGPSSGLVTGFARSIRHEYSSLEFRTLHLNADTQGESTIQAALVARIVRDRPRELEHNERTPGLLYVPRFAPDGVLSSSFSVPENPMYATDTLEQTQGRAHLALTRPGDPESLLLQETNTALDKELGDDEIKVRIVTSGINFKDVLIQAGIVDRPHIGGEASGVVEAVGKAVEHFQPGDRVLLLHAGAHAKSVNAKSWRCRHIPEKISFAEAASIPVNHCTAYFAMMMASVESLANKRILIHNASGGVGQVCIQIAQHLKMEVFTTVSSDLKRALLRNDYGIPDDHILYSRDSSFAMAIKRMTRGAGVDLVVNSMIGDLAQESLDCLSQYGTFIELSKNKHLQLRPDCDVRLVRFDLETMLQDWVSGFRQALDGSLRFLEQGITHIVSPVIAHPVSQAKKAMEAMQKPTHRGKLVLTWDNNDIVKFARAPVQPPDLQLDPHATYVLVGGFGGLGRSLARLFAHRGARHLTILGRSTVKAGTAAAALLKELRDRGVTVDVHALDISDATALGAIFDEYTARGPPIRGIVQSAMDLQDSLFGGMSLEEWNKSLSPKVKGTWNLHTLAPDHLDFFIMFSSFVALVGNLGQSNYGAGCAYQDSLAAYRRQQGLKAVSINLGVMKEIGVVAEGKVTGASKLKGWEVVGLGERDFHTLMRLVIDDQTHNRGMIPATLPTGLPSSKRTVGNPSSLDDPKFDLLHLNDAEDDSPLPNGTSGTESSSLGSRIRAAKDEDEAVAIILDAVIDRCARRVGIPREDIVTDMSLANYGFDSLSAVELQTWLVQAIGIRLNVFDVLNAGSLVELSRHCAQML